MEQSERDFKNAQVQAFNLWLFEHRDIQNLAVWKQMQAKRDELKNALDNERPTK